MIIKVKKFGGTSLYNEASLRNAAQIIIDDLSHGYKVVVVVSAASGQTDVLLNQIVNIGCEISSSEEDVVLSTGEQINAALLAMMLIKMGVNARSFLGWQLPIMTNKLYRNADIIDINVQQLKRCMFDGTVPIITGFQGIYDNRVTTLGRGGSDATAVKLAGILNAFKCEIYTDVDGIYVADPKIVIGAYKFKQLSCAIMHEAAMLGAKVMNYKAIDIAMQYNLNIEILSSFEDIVGTLLVKNVNNNEIMFCYRDDIYACLTSNFELLVNLYQNMYVANLLKVSEKKIVYVQNPNSSLLNEMKLYGDIVCVSELSIISFNMIFTLNDIINLLIKKGIEVFAVRECNNSRSFLISSFNEHNAINILYNYFYKSKIYYYNQLLYL